MSLVILSRRQVGVFQPYNLLLILFTCPPEACKKLSKIFLKRLAMSMETSPTNELLSLNWECLIFIAPLVHLALYHPPKIMLNNVLVGLIEVASEVI